MSMIGKTLGHYTVSALLGKGGMGEVYRAKDQKLGRDVAIKVLPEEFAKDDDRAARFQREAKLLASLNHNNIASIYGLEESDGIHFLVLELIEGDTLADRLKRGAIPVEESLKLALQIAEALEAAHEKGVIHRDLKPANIKVTTDGKVKVLDFGLAKAFAGEQGEMILSDSPTLSIAATQKGVILGTAAYMSPEQAKGRTVDKRTDIWAFGVVLYEMLTGGPLFAGEDVSSTLARVLEREPDFSVLPQNLHLRIRLLLERCLKKEVRNRYGSISDARVDVQEVLADSGGVIVKPASTTEPHMKSRQLLLWASISIALLIIVGIIVWNIRSPETRQVIPYDYHLPEGQQLIAVWTGLNISRDGRQIVYCTRDGLYLKPQDSVSATLIPGSDEYPRQPFFSPEGKWIAYFSPNDQKLKKITIEGGSPVTLCDAEDFMGGSWSEENFIVYSDAKGKIMRVSSNGGIPETLVEHQSKVLYGPHILPDGKSLLYTSAGADGSNPKITVNPLNSKEPKELFAGWKVGYLPSGYLLYRDLEHNLCAVPFDMESLKTMGESVVMIPSVDWSYISNSGTLVYTQRIPQKGEYTLVWVDREGNEESLGAPPDTYGQPEISPDGEKIAVVVGAYPSEDIYIWDIERKNRQRLVDYETRELQPIWTPDSKQIIYWSSHEDANQGGIYFRANDGTGKDKLLISAPDRILFPWSLSRDGKVLLMQDLPSYFNADISMLLMGENPERKLLLDSEHSEAQPMISPNGRWMTYSSNEETQEPMTGRIYVRSLPDVEGYKKVVSKGKGCCSLWSPDGKELFYLSGDNSVMVVAVEEDPTLRLGEPKFLFNSTYLGLTEASGTPWDIHPDGDRFLMIKPPIGATETATEYGRKFTIVLNWFEELKKKVPVE